MKVLIIHNHYQYSGGEDEVVKAEKAMLEKFGHKVILYEQSNVQINGFSLLKKLLFVLKDAYWSQYSYQKISKLIKEEKPAIAHFHNTFFLISPSAYDACFDAQIPIIQTIHNYRFLCPIGTFYRNGRICEDCLSRGKNAAVVNKCWRNSYFSSLVLTRVSQNIEKIKILSEKISHFIVLTSFSRQKFIDNGFDAGKISIKPNFLGVELNPSEPKGEYAIFIGALRPYKGVKTLAQVWKNFNINFPLKIIGNGPLYRELKKYSEGTKIELLGAKPLDETLQYIRKSLFVVVPSECYETFSRVIMEAFACAVPVIGTNHGALKDLIEHEKTGLLFQRGNINDLAQKINSLVENPSLARTLGVNARKEYEEKYTVEKNYKVLEDIYNRALEKFCA